jgi:hypothetical protein
VPLHFANLIDLRGCKHVPIAASSSYFRDVREGQMSKIDDYDNGVYHDRRGWHVVFAGRDLGVFKTPAKAWQHLMDEMGFGGYGPYRYGDAWRAVYFGRDLGVCATEKEVFQRIEEEKIKQDNKHRLKREEKWQRLNAFPRYKPVRENGSAVKSLRTSERAD